LFYLSSHSENEGVWSLVLGACRSRGDSGACGGSASGNRGGGDNSVAVVGGFHDSYSQFVIVR